MKNLLLKTGKCFAMSSFALLIGVVANAQTAVTTPLDYQTFIDRVKNQNLNYAAQQLNVGVAEAEIRAAKVFNDPTLSLEYADNDDRRMQMGRSVSAELSKTFAVGKRGANINLARSEKELSEALLDDYFRNLRAEATLAYIEALKQTELYRTKEQSCNNIRALAQSDSIRLAHGDINEADAMQSAIEAESAANDLLQAHTDLLNACSTLALFTGENDATASFSPASALKSAKQTFRLPDLIKTALANRADLAAALKDSEVAARQLKVAQKERNIDFDLSVGYNYNTEVKNEIAPAPKFNGLTVGLALPLKFSNTNRGALVAAELRRQQAEIAYQQAQLEVQNQVVQSLRQYETTVAQVEAYENGLHRKAQDVLNARIFSYNRGETSRAEVLIAQNTYDDLHAAYIETIAGNLAALVELERSIGNFDWSNQVLQNKF
jgi:cobalt-zinc-cadmium efflux system outer membrane protein